MRARELLWVALLTACGGEHGEPSEGERAADACTRFCEALPSICDELAQDVQQAVQTEGVDCVTLCVQGDEPEGEMQPLPFLQCQAAAMSCEDLAECKQQY